MAKRTKICNPIFFYGQKGEYAFLSNFYPCSLLIDGKTWPSVEHRYQAMKTTDTNLQEDIRLGYPLGTTWKRSQHSYGYSGVFGFNASATMECMLCHGTGKFSDGTCVNCQGSPHYEVSTKPGTAKKNGQKLKVRSDWECVKEMFMYEALKVKFENPELRQKLLDTGNAELVEHSPTDAYWGNAGRCGQNRLGALLMQLRDEIAIAPRVDYVPNDALVPRLAKKRLITVVLEVYEEQQAAEIYNRFREQRSLKGCLINAIVDGDHVKALEELENSI